MSPCPNISRAARACLPLLLACLAVPAGCGYRNLSRPPGRGGVFFAPTVNETLEPGLGSILRADLVDEMTRSGMSPVPSSEAVLRVESRVLKYEAAGEPARRSAARPARFEMVVVLELSVLPGELAGAGFTAPGPREIEVRRVFFRDGGYAQSESEVLALVSRDIARRSADWLVTVFPAACPEAGR